MVTTGLLMVAALAAGWLVGTRQDTDPGAESGDTTVAAREILYWVAPMDPNYRRDKPGKSPMGMDLIPVYADEAATDDGVTISPAVENNLGVRTAVATVRPLWRKIEATGYVGFDESRISHIHLRTEGWIVRLAIDADGERVTAGQLLFELYSPELVNAQKEYLQAVDRGDARLRRGGREKLRALGMLEQEVAELERSGQASEHVPVVAPQDGIVFDLSVREGMYVQPNVTVMSLADLATVWLNAEVFESQAGWVAVGQAAEARFDYLPGQVISGQVDYVYPVLDPVTRTLRVRLRFDNPDERLKPNMYARVSIFGKLQPSALSVPREALIRAPGRDRVVVAVGEGRYHVHEVMTGLESEDWVEIRAGIEVGDRVVTSAQFLIDSEASLSGSIQRLESVPAGGGVEPLDNVYGSGHVQAVDPARRQIRIAHGPIEALAWPSMTMEFDADPDVRLDSVQPGDAVRFALRQEHAGHWVVSELGNERDLPNVDPSKAEVAQPEPMPQAAQRFSGRATVKAVDPDSRVLNLAHEPIEALGWPGMTMNFNVDPTLDITAIRPGDEIHFMLRKKEGGGYVIDEIHALDDAAAMQGHQHHD